MRRLLALAAIVPLLLAGPVSSQQPVPPEGALVSVFLVSDGATLLPVASGVLPIVCDIPG